MDMKLIDVEYTFDGNTIICILPLRAGRFRELVQRPGIRIPRRIELRQIGVRDEARSAASARAAVRAAATRFSRDFQPVSIKMAKRSRTYPFLRQKSAGCAAG